MSKYSQLNAILRKKRERPFNKDYEIALNAENQKRNSIEKMMNSGNIKKMAHKLNEPVEYVTYMVRNGKLK